MATVKLVVLGGSGVGKSTFNLHACFVLVWPPLGSVTLRFVQDKFETDYNPVIFSPYF